MCLLFVCVGLFLLCSGCVSMLWVVVCYVVLCCLWWLWFVFVCKCYVMLCYVYAVMYLCGCVCFVLVFGFVLFCCVLFVCEFVCLFVV